MINCFENTILDEPFKKLVKEKGISDNENLQREEGLKLALDYHKDLHKELEDFKRSISLDPKKYKPETYIAPDNSKEVNAVNEKYDKLIADKQDEAKLAAENAKEELRRQEENKRIQEQQDSEASANKKVLNVFGADLGGTTVIGQKRQDAKEVYKQVNEIDTPANARGLALQFIAGGGKINKAEIGAEITGARDVNPTRLGRGTRGEIAARDYLTTDGKSIEDVAHDIWDNLPEDIQSNISDQDIKNALNEVVSENNTRFDAANKFLKEYGDRSLDEFKPADVDEDSFEEASNIIQGLSDEEIQKLANGEGWQPVEDAPEFSIRDSGTPEQEAAAGVIKDYIENGTTDLKSIQDHVAKVVGKDTPELRQQVKDAFDYYNEKYIPKEIHTGVVNRIKQTFGKLLDKGVHVYKDSKELMSAAAKFGSDTKFQTLNNRTEAFYSPLEKFINNNRQGAFTPEQILGQIKSLPQNEIDFIGLKDFLKGKSKITKKELQDFVRENKIIVEVVTKGGDLGLTGDKTEMRKGEILHTLSTAGYEISHDMSGDMEVLHNGEVMEEAEKDMPAELFKLAQEYYDLETYGPEKLPSSTKYDQYTLPGNKSNYREVLLTLPNQGVKPIDKWAFYEREGYTKEEFENAPQELQQKLFNDWKAATSLVEVNKKQQFFSSHFDEPSIIAHIRLTDRTTPDGKRILFVEESQSDWAREQRKRGIYDGKTFGDVEVEKNKQIVELTKRNQQIEKELTAETGDSKKLSDEYNANANKILSIQDEIKGMRRSSTPTGTVNPNGVPDMPFKNDKWVELATKKAIQIAASEGYDGIAWINGEQTKDRYDLSQQVDYIKKDNAPENILPNTDYVDISTTNGMINLQVDRSSGIIKKEGGNGRLGSEGKHLEDVVGKDVAEKIMNAKDGTRLEKPDLKVGGKWANNLYDKQIPKLVEKYSKQYGGKISEFGIDTTEQRYAYKEKEYVGKVPTLYELKQIYEVAKKGGRDIFISPITGEKQEWAINRVTNEHALRNAIPEIENGKDVTKAMQDNGVDPKLFGGDWKPIEKQNISKQFGIEITPDMKAKTESLPMFMYGKQVDAKSAFEKARIELKNAEDKISQKQATQTGLFAESGKQSELFGVGRDEAKDILDPLRQKVKETRAAYEQEQKDAANKKFGTGQQSLFQKINREVLGFVVPEQLSSDQFLDRLVDNKIIKRVC